MKTRLVSMTYRGSASVDPRFSAVMLPWTVNDIRSTENYTKLSVGIENGKLESYNLDFELQFSHPLRHIVGMCRITHKRANKSIGNGFLPLKLMVNGSAGSVSGICPITHNDSNNGSWQVLTTSTSHGSLSTTTTTTTTTSSCLFSTAFVLQQNAQSTTATDTQASDAASYAQVNNFMEFAGPLTGLVYLLKEPKDPLLHIYLFECETVEEMAELMHQMRDPAHTLGGSVGSIPQTLVSNTNAPSIADQAMQCALSGSIHITPASNLKLTESARISAQNETNLYPIAASKMKSSKSYTHGLSNSAGTVNIPTSTSAQSNLSLLADISPNHTHFFEVMYVGKIRVSHKRVPFTFIDDALPKFKAYDAQRMRILQMTTNRKTSLSTESVGLSNNSNLTFGIKSTVLPEHDVKEEEEEEEEENVDEKVEKYLDIQESIDCKVEIKEELISQIGENDILEIEEEPNQEPLNENKNKKGPRRLLRGNSQMELPVQKDERQNIEANAKESEKLTNVIVNKNPSPPRQDKNQQQHKPQIMKQNTKIDNIPKLRDRSASYGSIPPYVEQNRTMVFLVGRSDLRLISPDRKQVLLYKDFKDVASCAQGQKNADHFGIICREAHNDGYIGYVFKCQSDQVCDDIVAAISQAFVTCAEQKRKEANQIFSCDHCPMLWYHKLCADIEGMSEKKTQTAIFRRIESLTDDEQDTIWAKFYGSEKMSAPLTEQNLFLMMLLRAHCESRQQRHVHDTAENRSEFLNQYLGGSTIFMKAKRSLTNSFDHLLKRKASKDDIGVTQGLQMPRADITAREGSAEPYAVSKSSGIDTPPEGFRSRSNTLGASPSRTSADQLKSPMMDIFMKVGNSPKEAEAHQGSWRQAILNSVVTPSKGGDTQADFLSPMRMPQIKKGKRTKEELRELWKTAIRQTILLNRMETENAMLQARQNMNELKRIKLDYEEIMPCDKQLIDRWEKIIERDSVKIGNKKDPHLLTQAIRTGVPRSKRGEVWGFLAEQHSMQHAPVDTRKFPNFNTPYHTLLKNLTEHQHAIFIDLGRTFPNHTFYKDPLGLGQLSLFNLLKAYSILDPELGYCQGLGFICGILLLHCGEAEAFELLKHLMFRRQMRTKYLPDMKKFQLQLYQLSRLVKDYLGDLYSWLDQNEVSPTLYAAPWILTVFSSQFPLGFVARVFDLLFLESSEIIFKFAIALLTMHKNELLACDNFEEIMDYLKTVVPKIDAKIMENVMKMVFTMDINKQLAEYNVEYNVLQEEISTTNHHLEMLNREKAQSQHLEQQLQFAQSSIAQLDKTRTSQQTQITTLQSQVQSLELTIQTLGTFVSQLANQNVDMELPTDVRRILQQLDDLEKQRRKSIFTERKIGKSVSVNSHLGFPLKVLQELIEKEELGSSQKTKPMKTPFFENTYEQLRQQQQQHPQQHRTFTSSSNASYLRLPMHVASLEEKHPMQRPNRLMDSAISVSEMQNKLDELKLPEHVDKFISNIKSPMEADSGVGTPLSPPSSSSSSGGLFSRMGYKNVPAMLSPLASHKSLNVSKTAAITTIARDGGSSILLTPSPREEGSKSMAEEKDNNFEEMHPLSMVGDVSVRFNGTTQLKTIRPMHHIRMVNNKNIKNNNNNNHSTSNNSIAECTPSVERS